MYWAYDLGTSAIGIMTKNAKELTRSASILGVFVVGALIANFGGGTQFGIDIPNGESVISLQEKLDTILPCMLPFALTCMCWYLLSKKGWKPIQCILLLLVIGIVGCAVGIWSGDYTALISVPWHA